MILLGSSSNIFTSVLYNHYSAPNGFCFDINCRNDPIITDPESTEYNWNIKVRINLYLLKWCNFPINVWL